MMTQDYPSLPDEITCEDITDEIVASYREQGYTLFFAEEVMRYDLSLAVPQITPRPVVSYLTWDEQRTHEFFTVYQASFRERPGFPGWSEEEWVSREADDPLFRPKLCFLAVVEGRAVGFVTNGDDDVAPERDGYIIQLGVDPQWRGQRLGAALVTRSLRAWQEEGKEAVLLHVNPDNHRAVKLYQQLGFVRVQLRGKFRRLTEENVSSQVKQE